MSEIIWNAKNRQSIKFEETKLIEALNLRNSSFLPIINKIYTLAEQQLGNRVPAIFSEYTQHDINHSIRIMEYISRIIDNIDELNDFEITLLI